MKYSPEDLYNAWSTGNIAKVKKCLDSGLSPDYCTRAFGRPLWMTVLDKSIVKNDIPMVQLLLNYGPDFTGRVARDKVADAMMTQSTGPFDQWSTPLHYAMEKENDSILKLLIRQGAADVNACDCAGASPLHVAASIGRSNHVKLLLENGADINAINGKEATALHVAAGKGDHETAQLLIQHGTRLDLRNLTGQTALMHAVAKQQYEVTKILASTQADFEVRDKRGFTAFFLAAANLDATTMALLANMGADIEARDRNGCTALIRAVMAKNEALANVLLSFGVNIDTKDSDGWTALYAAMVNGDENLARILVDNGADTQGIDPDGNTLLHSAAKTGSAFIIRFLLSRGMDPNKRNNNQETSLHVASTNGHRNNAHLLLANKTTEISAVDTSGRTSLHCAAASGQLAIVQELVSKGATISTLDYQMHTPICSAMKANHLRIIHYLESRGARFPKNFNPEFSVDPPPYEMPTDICRLRSKQGKAASPPNEPDEAEDPFEVSIPKPVLPDPKDIITIIRQEAGKDPLKTGVDVASAGLNLVGTLLGT